MAVSGEAAAQKSNVPSLAEQAEQKFFEELAKHIQNESKQSVFAVGGSIPITARDNHLICESDYTGSDSGGENSMSRPRESDTDHDTVVIDSSEDEEDRAEAPSPASEPGAVAHKMRCDPITIPWDSTAAIGSSYKVTLPSCDLRARRQGRFGTRHIARLGKLDETDFCTNFNPYALGIIDAAAQALAPNNCTQTNETHGVRAELYKLNVYAAPSGMFKAHVDTPRSKHQIGSLVVCLPCVHEGGQLVPRHQGRETVFDWSGGKSSKAIQWAAFYSDCEHEVLEVTAGERVTLTYNLYATCSANTALIDPEQVGLYHTLKMLLDHPGFGKNGLTLGYHCVHAYEHTSKETIAALPATLKGVDKVVYACFRAIKHPVRLRHLLAMNEMERFSCYEDLLEEYWTKDPGRIGDLKRLYLGKERTTRGRRWISWELLDKNSKVDVDLLADDLVSSTSTSVGIDDSHRWSDIIHDWTDSFSLKQVKWLNQASHEEMALTHGAYGNQPSVETSYAKLVITMEIPPFQDR